MYIVLQFYRECLSNNGKQLYRVKKTDAFIFKLAANLLLDLSVPMCTANMRWSMIAKVQFHSNFYH